MDLFRRIGDYFFYDRAEDKRIGEIKGRKKTATYGPKYVTLDITNRCNLNCIACWTYSPLIKKGRPSKNWYSNELSYETIYGLVTDLKKLGTREIRLTGGGEPFMHPRIFDIINLIKKKGMALDITTNFTLLDQKRIRDIVSMGVDNITVSLWAASPDTYAATHPREKRETFGRLIENIFFLNTIKKKTKVVIANVLLKSNHHELYEMASLAEKIMADEVYFTVMDPVDETRRLLLTKKEQKKLIRFAEKLLEDYQNKRFGNLQVDNPENLLRRIKSIGMRKGFYDSDIIYQIPCTIGYTFSRVMASGDVAPCCKSVNFPTGNINKARFKDLWNNKQQMLFRKRGFSLKKYPEFVKKVGCLKTCDNLMQNIETYGKII